MVCTHVSKRKAIHSKEDLDAAMSKVQEERVSIGKVCILFSIPEETLRQ